MIEKNIGNIVSKLKRRHIFYAVLGAGLVAFVYALDHEYQRYFDSYIKSVIRELNIRSLYNENSQFPYLDNNKNPPPTTYLR